jgi:hypothetical protein
MQHHIFSVKNTIERVVQGQIAVCLSAVKAGSYAREHFTEMAETVEKFIASLYISGQIDRDFSVETSMSALRVIVKFSVNKDYSIVDNMLPAELGMKYMKTSTTDDTPLPDITHVEFDQYQDAVFQFSQQKNLIKEQIQAQEQTLNSALTVLREGGGSDQEIVEFTDEFTQALSNYERAKKFLIR